MTATGADVALYTNDGVVVQSPPKAASDALKAAHIDAQGDAADAQEMCWVNPNHAQIILDERFTYVGRIDPIHEGIEVEESLKLGTDVPIAPVIPSFQVVDASRKINAPCRTRAYASDLSSDRCSVEVLQ
jgi:hypothetical protein